MQEQEIHDLVASVLDALKTQQAFPAPSVGQGGRLSAMQSEQRPLTGSGAEPELLAATVDADTGASLEDLGGSAFRKNFHFELDFSVLDRCSAEHHITSVLRNAGGGIAADIGILADIFSLSDEL